MSSRTTHERVADGRMRAQRRLDLAGLDAEAADLHLLVGAAEVLDLAVGPEAGQVARQVQPGTRLVGVGIADEAFRGELGTAR